MTETILAIKNALKAATKDDPRLVQWRADSRQGVQKALAAFDRQQKKLAEQKAGFLSRFAFEEKLWAAGYQAVAGVDEVGRGPLAGPVVAAAVILPRDFDQYGVVDSKQVSEKHRLEYLAAIKDQAVAYGIGVVSAQIIDQVNIYQASRLAMKAAVDNLVPAADYLLVDAMTIDSVLPQESLIKGDSRSNSIGAASILAKVTRDQMMVAYDQEYPGYGFADNAGYGTKKHLAGLAHLGPTPIHRRSFAPVKKYLTK